MPEIWKLELKVDDFLQKLKKVVRIVLYGPAIGQIDCRKQVCISSHMTTEDEDVYGKTNEMAFETSIKDQLKLKIAMHHSENIKCY